MSDLNGRLSALCLEAMKAAGADREKQAEVIERLINATAFTIAIFSEGQKAPMDMLLAGAEQQLYVAAAGHKTAGQMIAAFNRKATP
jgi:hypothetical protein